MKESEIRISGLDMPLFYQQDINEFTRLAVWQIAEGEDFFLQQVPLQREITHPHKRLQHLAGRLLLKEMFPDFPYELIRIADTRKPFLSDEQYHFSISHAGDAAAVIISKDHRVGVDVEWRSAKVMKVLHKFLGDEEKALLYGPQPYLSETLFWSVKESLFKWHGDGALDFKEHMHILGYEAGQSGIIPCRFSAEPKTELDVHYRIFGDLCLTYAATKQKRH
ncbi:MAG: 4'-phosphopantetheinyl transferase family protein [Sphingobacteriales bacterium]